jgi:RNA polymerase sigma factor (TIGR02999 family)
VDAPPAPARFPTAPAADPELTGALCDLAAGRAGADARVMPLIYARLRELADWQLAGERAGHTLQPTALVNEAYLKLVGQRSVPWENRGQFFVVAAQAMRRILLDHARARGRQKRGGGQRRIELDLVDRAAPVGPPELDIIALDEALERLAADDSVAARVVELRFFAGMEVGAIAEVLGVTDRTVRRHWVYARAWLLRELSRGTGDEP